MRPGTTALVTGGSQRIGAAIVRKLAEKGAQVFFTYRNSTDAARTLESAIRSGGGKATALHCDLEDPASVRSVFDELRSHSARLDILINNASSFIASPTTEWSAENWNQALNTNARGAFLCALSALPLMQNGGNIINLIDLTAFRPRSGYLLHGVSKAALQALTQALALELGPSIRVNAVCPGAMLPPAGVSAESAQEKLDRSALKTWGGEAPVVEAVLHLIENTFITGETLKVDGGASLY